MSRVEFIQVTAYVDGIAKRCRKVDRHRIELVRLPDGSKPELTPEIIQEARRKIPLLMKSVQKVIVHFSHQYEDDHMRGFKIFDPRNKSYTLEVSC